VLVVVGRVGRAHGIRGDVAVDVRTDEPERRFARHAVLRAGSRQLTVSGSRWHSGRLLVTFAEVADRTAAEQLRGTLLEADIDPDELPTDEGEFYDRQLIGLEVRSAGADADAIGQVVSVVHHGEQDTLVVRTRAGEEILVPFVTAIVPTVDLVGGYIVVAELPGLLNPSEAQ
jgi:16S rRNA processing protein RimM